jgi:hypothetical protein
MVGVLAAAMVLVVRLAGAGLASFDIMLLNRTLSLGPLLFALAFAVQGRFRTSFLIAGLAFNIHATTAAHAAILISFAAAFGPRRLFDALVQPLWFVLGALPLLVRIVTTGGAAGVPFPAPDDWFEAQRLLVWFHHFPSLWPRGYWAVLIPPLLAVVISQRRSPNRAVLAFLCGIVCTCLAGFVGVEILHLPIALQLHLQEVVRFLPFVGAASLAGWAVTRAASPGGWVRASVAVAAIAFDQALTYPASPNIATTASTWLLLGVLALEVWRPVPRAWTIASGPSVTAMISICVLVVIGGHYFRKAEFATTYDHHYESRIAAWSRANLPADAHVALPPYYYLGAAPLLNYRWAAQRRVLATLKDGGETTFSLSYFHEWRRRIEDEIGRPLDFTIPADFRSHRDDWIVGAVADYGTADADRFRLLASRYGVTHAVTEAGAAVQPQLPLLYQDDRYRLYSIPLP